MGMIGMDSNWKPINTAPQDRNRYYFDGSKALVFTDCKVYGGFKPPANWIVVQELPVFDGVINDIKL